MSKIGNIFLVWRKGTGSKRIPVGIIKKNSSNGTRFKYIDEKVEEAKKYGFIPYTGFPNVEKEYSENVMSIFAQRLSKSERNDLDDFYNFWKVDTDRKNDSYYMLAQTQGILPIDNFEFLADFNPKKGLNFITEIEDLSASKIAPNELAIGDQLSYKLEVEDKKVKVFKDDLFLGDIKVIHSNLFFKVKSKIEIKAHHIEKNGKLKRVFIEVKL